MGLFRWHLEMGLVLSCIYSAYALCTVASNFWNLLTVSKATVAIKLVRCRKSRASAKSLVSRRKGSQILFRTLIC